MKITIQINGSCIHGCGREGTFSMPITDGLRENAAKYEKIIERESKELCCDECYMLKLTGLAPVQVQEIIASSSSGE